MMAATRDGKLKVVGLGLLSREYRYQMAQAERLSRAQLGRLRNDTPKRSQEIRNQLESKGYRRNGDGGRYGGSSPDEDAEAQQPLSRHPDEEDEDNEYAFSDEGDTHEGISFLTLEADRLRHWDPLEF